MQNVCCEIGSLLSNLERIASRATNYIATNGNEFLQNNGTSGTSVGIGAALIVIIVVMLILQRPRKQNNPSVLPAE